MKAKQIKKMLFILIVVTLILPNIIARSTAWSTDLNKDNEEYYDVMNQLKNNQSNLTNESELTPEEKESLRIKNNLLIAKQKGVLSPSQEKQLDEIEKEEFKLSREENKGLIIYIIIGILIVGFIFWMANIND